MEDDTDQRTRRRVQPKESTHNNQSLNEETFQNVLHTPTTNTDSKTTCDQMTQGQRMQYKTAQEYADAVRNWLWQYQTWNCMSQQAMMFPLYASMGQSLITPSGPTATLPNGIRVSTSQTRVQDGVGVGAQIQGNRHGVTFARGSEYKIPPIWKRVAAEFIDFLLLFVLKITVTLIAVEYMGLIDLEHFDFDYMLLKGDLDYEKALSLSSEIIVMEVVNRVFVAIFEAFCLRKGVGGRPGGSTPGKRIMGLKVVSCIDVVTLDNGKLFIIPARDIGFLNSLARSVVKNFSIAFFFPVCFTVMFFQHNRAAYDIISTSVVVEINRHD